MVSDFTPLTRTATATQAQDSRENARRGGETEQPLHLQDPDRRPSKGRRRSFTETSSLLPQDKAALVERSPLSLSSSGGKREPRETVTPSRLPHTPRSMWVALWEPLLSCHPWESRGMELSDWEPGMEKGQPHRGLGGRGGVRGHPSRWLCSSQKRIRVRWDQGAQQLAQIPDSDTHTRSPARWSPVCRAQARC